MISQRTGGIERNSSHITDERVQRIIGWRESLAKMPDNHFFELVRMYLGEVRTPYNKQKLIEELGNFFRKDENRRMLVSLLSDADVCVITAVFTISAATQEKLTLFFQGMFPFAGLYERLLNLEERLILYRVFDQNVGMMVFAVNPLLEEILQPFADINLLLPPANVDPLVVDMNNSQIATSGSHDTFTVPSSFSNDVQVVNQPYLLSPQFLAAFVAFASLNPGMCKADGSLKKRTDSLLVQCFPQCRNKSIFLKLVLAFRNLSLFTLDDNELTVNFDRLAKFTELPPSVQYATITAAAVNYRSRTDIIKYAQLLLDMISGIPETGFTLQVLVRSAFLIRSKDNTFFNGSSNRVASRFSQILQAGGIVSASGTSSGTSTSSTSGVSSGASDNKDDKNSDDISTLVENARLFGLLKSVKSIDTEEIVYFSNMSNIDIELLPEKKLASIDAGFSITLMPGLSFAELLKLEQFMDIAYFDTITSLEITRQSCFRAFDEGITGDEILETLQNYAMHDIPQNLVFSIKDWSKAFNSVSLYFGFILKVDEDKIVLVKNNKLLSPHIVEILAPGILLLDFTTPAEAATVIDRSGLDFIGSTKTALKQKNETPFPTLRKSDNYFSMLNKIPNRLSTISKSTESVITSQATVRATGSLASKKSDITYTRTDEKTRAELFSQLRTDLQQLNLPKDQEEGLLSRINRKIVLNPIQLRGDSVRMEKLEASGMDFLGKVHVIEHAIATASMIEIATEDDSVLMGSPVSIDKAENDAVVHLRIEPHDTVEVFSIGKARHVRRIRGSIFKEPGI